MADNSSYNKIVQIKSAISLLQYQIAIYGIYIERLMNPCWKLTKGNINKESNILEEIVSYFDVWMEQRSVVKVKESLKDIDVDK